MIPLLDVPSHIRNLPGLWPVTLYYDGSCPMCLTEMTNLMLRNTHGLLHFVDASVPGFDACPSGTTQRDLMTVLHAQRADGALVLGIPAFELAYEGAGIVFVAKALRAPIIKPIMVWLYPWVAANRQHLPAWLAYAVFGGAMRRAAERAAAQQCQPDQDCRLPRTVPQVGNYTPASADAPDRVNRKVLAGRTPWMTLHADELRKPPQASYRPAKTELATTPMPLGAKSPSPLAGEGLGRGGDEYANSRP